MRMSDLQSKKIISIVNGKSIGNIIDCDINEHGGIDRKSVGRERV